MTPDERMDIVREVCARYNGGRTGMLLSILSDITDRLRYIPEEAIEHIAETVEAPPATVRLVCGRSARYTTDEVGRHLIVVCDGSDCHCRGSIENIQALEFALGIKLGETTSDGLFTLKSASCVGACANAPVLIVDETMRGHARNNDIPKIIEQLKEVESR
ncbi:MAG: NAD(P)H-dependent oxidoreductase subunit E [Eggerthellaceae bacterium]|nr:NAD(P)H-dependent oxidoreductase subunit E [Eggerthellaceae bacterium]